MGRTAPDLLQNTIFVEERETEGKRDRESYGDWSVRELWIETGDRRVKGEGSH